MSRGTCKKPKGTKTLHKSNNTSTSNATTRASTTVATRSNTARRRAQAANATTPKHQEDFNQDADASQDLEKHVINAFTSEVGAEQHNMDSLPKLGESAQVLDENGSDDHGADVNNLEQVEADETGKLDESDEFDEMQSARAQGDSWLPWQDRALADQVNAERPFSAGHGKVGAAWDKVARGLEFEQTGDACKKRFNLLLGRHKVLCFTYLH